MPQPRVLCTVFDINSNRWTSITVDWIWHWQLIVKLNQPRSDIWRSISTSSESVFFHCIPYTSAWSLFITKLEYWKKRKNILFPKPLNNIKLVKFWVVIFTMGKLNVTILRYLTKEDFRALTAVSYQCCKHKPNTSALTCSFLIHVRFRSKWVWKIMSWYRAYWLHLLQILNQAVFTNFCVNYANINSWPMNVDENVRPLLKTIHIWGSLYLVYFMYFSRWLPLNQHWLRLFGIEISHIA